MQNALWHVVLISFREEASPAQRHEIYSRYQTIAEECGGQAAGILFWKVDGNLDLRKSDHLVEIAVFESEAALQAFQAHPKRKELTDILCEVADWHPGDIWHPWPDIDRLYEDSSLDADSSKVWVGPRLCSLNHIKGRIDIIDPLGEVPMYDMESDGKYDWGCPNPLHAEQWHRLRTSSAK